MLSLLCVSLSHPLSVCVVSWLLCSSFLGMRVLGLFLLCVSLRVPCVSYVSWWSVGCLWLLAFLCGVVTLCVWVCFLCWLGCVGCLGLLVVYVSFMCADYCSSLCVVRMSVLLVGVSWVCVCVFCSSYFRFSFVLLCVSPGFCVWFWVCGGLFLGVCLVGVGFGVVGFWVWGGGFVLWGGCWWCCFLGVVGVGVVLWAILLLLFLLLFFCLECGFGGCWAWCCCW